MVCSALLRSVLAAGTEFVRGSDVAELVAQLGGCQALPVLSVLLGGVVFFVFVVLRRRGRRGAIAAFSGQHNNSDLSFDDILQGRPAPVITVRKSKPPEELGKRKGKERGKEPANGQPRNSSEIQTPLDNGAQGPSAADKKQMKPKKKKRKTDNVEEKFVKDTFPGKDKTEEEMGVWVTKISSREKRQLRKERMKQKDPVKGSSPQALVGEGSSHWGERADREAGRQGSPQGERAGPVSLAGWGAVETKPAAYICRESQSQDPGKAGRRPVEWVPPGTQEEDIFSHVGTWDLKDLKSEPVTFGTVPDFTSEFGASPEDISSQASPSHGQWRAQMASLGVDEAWLGLDDPFDVDQSSDWNPPSEEWGNWCEESSALAQPEGHRPPGQGPGKKLKEDGEKGSASVKSSQWEADDSDIKGLAGTGPSDEPGTKKDRKKKKKKMRKET
ncbi:LYRIC protein, partial [Amia calva]|nr:LYRIC protein [Amia calva]